MFFPPLPQTFFHFQTRFSIASPLYLCDRNHEPDKHLVDQLLKDQRWTTWRWPRTVQLHDIQYSIPAIFSAITMSTSPFMIYERSLCFCLLLSLCYIALRWCYRRLYYLCPLSFVLVPPFSTQWWQYSEVLLGDMLELLDTRLNAKIGPAKIPSYFTFYFLEHTLANNWPRLKCHHAALQWFPVAIFLVGPGWWNR